MTGVTGFKGRWLAAWLKQLGAVVSGFGLAPESPEGEAFWRQVSAECDCSLLDIRDADQVLRFVRDREPELVFHLAAQPLVRLSYREPAVTLATNVMGTVHLFEAIRQAPSVRAVVNVTSDKCYENREWTWGYRENEPMGGADPYSVSKGCAELITAAWRRSYFESAGVAVASARAGNVIGGGDWAADRIVPDLVRGVLANKVIPIRSPSAVRPWQHVLEPLSGYLILGARLLEDGAPFAQGWNFGPSTEDRLTVGELAEEVVRVFGRGQLEIAPYTDGGLHEAMNLKLDSSLAATRLGWKALLTNASRVEWTINWYRAASAQPERMAEFAEQQIGQYEERIRKCPRMNAYWSAASVDSSVPRSRAA